MACRAPVVDGRRMLLLLHGASHWRHRMTWSDYSVVYSVMVRLSVNQLVERRVECTVRATSLNDARWRAVNKRHITPNSIISIESVADRSAAADREAMAMSVRTDLEREWRVRDGETHRWLSVVQLLRLAEYALADGHEVPPRPNALSTRLYDEAAERQNERHVPQ